MKKLACAFLAAITAISVIVFAGCSKEPDPDDARFANAVSYAAFGAVGDGVTNDFAALKKAHEYANENGVPVAAEKGATYYIGPDEGTIPVKTDVDWTGASFIIDDKSAAADSETWRYSLFTVQPDVPPEDVEIPAGYTLAVGQKNVGLRFDKAKLLAVFNDDKRDFIRHTSGTHYPRQEILLVDEDGNVDPLTPVVWEYTQVTRLKAYATDDKPLLLRGGTFTTIANDDPRDIYYERGIRVDRANTTVKNVQHFVTDEGEFGSPYNGFFRTVFTSNVLFENCVMSGHKKYTQGTYDTRLLSSHNVRYRNCTQANDYTDPALWGVMCSDYCKNISMEGCKLSRFDAHMGVYNASVKDSEIGQHVSVTGGGTLLLENVVTYAKKGSWFNRFVTLRDDYGSFFYGDIIIKDCTMYTERGINYLLAGAWYDWDFGYECRYPKTVTIDNVRLITDTDEYDHGCLYIFSQQSKDTTYEDALKTQNPPVLTEKIIIKNNLDPKTNTPKTTFKTIPQDGADWFKSTVLEYA